MGFLVLAFSTILYCVLHSLAASNKVKSFARDLFGTGADRWYRFIFNLTAGVTFLPILWFLAVLPDRTLYVIKMPWLLLMLVGQLVGVVVIVVGLLQTGALSFLGIKQLVFQERAESDAVFVTEGLYKWVRHPLYTGGLIIIWLMPVMTVNLLTVFVVLTLYLVVGAKLEEERLLEEFGERYERYKRDVPMLIPKVPKR